MPQMHRKAALYTLNQVNTLSKEKIKEFTEKGYSLEEFVEVKVDCKDYYVPHPEFAKTALLGEMHKNLIEAYKDLEDYLEDPHDYTVMFERSEWVDSISASGKRAYDCAYGVIVTDLDNGKVIEHFTVFYRVEINF